MEQEFPFSVEQEFLFPMKLLAVKVLALSLEHSKAGFEKFPFISLLTCWRSTNKNQRGIKMGWKGI